MERVNVPRYEGRIKSRKRSWNIRGLRVTSTGKIYTESNEISNSMDSEDAHWCIGTRIITLVTVVTTWSLTITFEFTP